MARGGLGTGFLGDGGGDGVLGVDGGGAVGVGGVEDGGGVARAPEAVVASRTRSSRPIGQGGRVGGMS